MFDPVEWLDDCEAALVDADFLAAWMARSKSADVAAQLDELRIRIAVLRAELQRARAGLGGKPRTGPPRGKDDSNRQRWAKLTAPWAVKDE